MSHIEVINADEVAKKFSEYEGKLEGALTRGVNDCVTRLRTEIVSNYVTGQVLGVVTGNLSSNINEHNAEKKGDCVVEGMVTSKANSPSGFAYDTYWERDGGKPFMRPAADSLEGEFADIVSEEVQGIF